MNRVFLIGCPGTNGGANTEALHTIQLWRRHGAEVHVLPTWGRDSRMEKQLAELGCRLHFASGRTLNTITELPGSSCVMFCNRKAYGIAHKLRALDCRTVHVPCMCFLRREEEIPIKEHGPDVFCRTVYQSRFQRGRLEPRLTALGVRQENGRLIRGAFAYWDPDWSYAPRRRDRDREPFVVGKLARDARSKWFSGLWGLYGQIPNVRAMTMGMGTKVREQLGTVPRWATCLGPCGMDTVKFLHQLHCLCPPNDRDEENWPRVGLEAMALGVAVVAERRFGWAEMIEHGATGLLAETVPSLADEAAKLEKDEELRLELTRAARDKLETDLAQEDVLWGQWQEVLWG